ncbi:MAG TPA: hypothetical protein VGX50_11135 [Longimicrobium sp.]|nr:hypothetical protein [Longimicrobium sp.]
MSTAVAKADRALERGVAVLDRWHIAPALRGLCAVSIAVIPAAQAYAEATGPRWLVPILQHFGSPVWLIPLFVSLALLVPLTHYRQGGLRKRLLRQLAYINGSFAGSLLSFNEKINAINKRNLDENQCEALCASLLHRIRDYTAFALDAGPECRLRANLAVPYSATGADTDSLRVWCYDEPHSDRGWTVVPLEMNGKVAPGSPAAYCTGAVQIIDDITLVPGPASARVLPYRSVLSIPLDAKGADGKPLAVINIDADEPRFFDAQRVSDEVRPLVSPVITAIGLVLSSRKKGHPYGFPR